MPKPALAALAATAALAALPACTPMTSAAPPTGDAARARAQLAELTVAPEGPATGYDREKFPHWTDRGDSCDTRELVLERDGDNVRTGGGCRPESGTWRSPYDGETWTDPADVDIDHRVPLREAWISGAASWTTARREDFANDLHRPQLITVTDNINQAKGARDPAEWLPPLEAARCDYAVTWIAVKHHYGLAVDRAEKSALADLLDGSC